MGVARRRCKVGVNAGCKGSKDQTGHGRKKHWSYYQLKSEKARPHGYLLGIGHRALGIGGEGDVRLPATGMLLLYSVSQEGADKRRQQWMIHEQPDGEGVVGSRSSATAKIQKMPEWLERRRKKGKRVKSKTSAVCGTNPGPVLVAHHHHRDTPPSGQGKKGTGEYCFFLLLGVCPPGTSSKSRLRIVLFPCDGCPHTPPPHVQLGKMAVRVFDPIHPLTTAHGPA